MLQFVNAKRKKAEKWLFMQVFTEMMQENLIKKMVSINKLLAYLFQRRDQVMWNTLSIQYNPLIEEEWDEHYRVTCEYGSDFWKTVTFPSIGVE